MKTLGGLITYWQLAGYSVTTRVLYRGLDEFVEKELRLQPLGPGVFCTTVTRNDLASLTAYIVHRGTGDIHSLKILGMLSADLHHPTRECFIKNAKLSELANYMT